MSIRGAAAAACGADAKGGAGTRLGFGTFGTPTGMAGLGMPDGGGIEPAAGALTVFFPRRDFRSILGFLSSIGARHYAGIIEKKG